MTDANTSESCYSFGHKEIMAVIIAKSTISGVGLITCIVALLFIWLTQLRKEFVYRLVSYLMFAALLESLAFLSEEILLENDGDEVILRNTTAARGFCVFSGFFSEIAVIGEDMVMCWIMVYLLSLVYSCSTSKKRALSGDVHGKKMRSEIIGIAISVIIPFVIAAIPFINSKYGFSGLWCWIKLLKSDGSCDEDIIGLIYMSLFYYGPMTLVAVFSLISFVVITIQVFITLKTKTKRINGLWQAFPLVLYAIFYDALSAITLANRIYYVTHLNKDVKPLAGLWLTVAICDPIRTLFPSIVFFLSCIVWEKAFPNKCRRKIYEPSAATYFRVSKKNSCDTDEESLVIVQDPKINYQTTNIFDAIPV